MQIYTLPGKPTERESSGPFAANEGRVYFAIH